MDIVEIKDIAQSLKRRLELLAVSGITAVPKNRIPGTGMVECPSDWSVFSGPLADAASIPSFGDDGQKGVLFGVWTLGGAAVIWGVPVTGASLADRPFGRESLSQLEKMLIWLAEQIKAGKPDITNPHAVLASKGRGAGSYSDTDAAEAAAKDLRKLTKGAKGLLLMGELATWAILQTADPGGGRGTVHRTDGRAIVFTFSPDELLKGQEIKRGAHADLKLLISALAG